MQNHAMMALADRDYKEALSRYTDILQDNHLLMNIETRAKTLSNLSLVYRRMGDYYSALSYQKQAIALLEETTHRRALSSSLYNTGNIYMKPNVWLELTDTAGQLVYKTEPQQRVVLPQSEREFKFPLAPANVSPGEYMLMIIGDYDVPELIAAQARININAGETPTGGGETETDADGSGGATGIQPPPTG